MSVVNSAGSAVRQPVKCCASHYPASALASLVGAAPGGTLSTAYGRGGPPWLSADRFGWRSRPFQASRRVVPFFSIASVFGSAWPASECRGYRVVENMPASRPCLLVAQPLELSGFLCPRCRSASALCLPCQEGARPERLSLHLSATPWHHFHRAVQRRTGRPRMPRRPLKPSAPVRDLLSTLRAHFVARPGCVPSRLAASWWRHRPEFRSFRSPSVACAQSSATVRRFLVPETSPFPLVSL